MDNQERIEIAKDFIAKHKENDINNWPPFDVFGEQKLLIIYQRMVTSHYAPTRVFDAGNGPECELALSALNMADDKPCIFWWFDDSLEQENDALHS